MTWGAMSGGHMTWGVIDEGWRKGPWTAEEDRLLMEYVRLHGEGRWNSVARLAGLKRNGKSCRLRWVNYLRPDLKRGQITPHEEGIILELHARWGNKWSTIARSLPGRTDNEIKNYWRTHFKKKAKLSPENSEKAKARLLKRQQFQQKLQQEQESQQQLQQQQEQDQFQNQQEQLLQLHQLDMKKIMSLLEENEPRSPYMPQQLLARQEMGTTTTTSGGGGNYLNTTEEQSFFFPLITGNAVGVNDVMNEEFLWDGLWNLDDIHGNLGAAATCAPSKVATFQSLVC